MLIWEREEGGGGGPGGYGAIKLETGIQLHGCDGADQIVNLGIGCEHSRRERFDGLERREFALQAVRQETRSERREARGERRERKARECPGT